MNKYAAIGIVLIVVIIAAAYIVVQPPAKPTDQGTPEQTPTVESGDLESSSSALQQDINTLENEMQPVPGQEILDV